jgi:gliding motility-associated-like protein
MKKLLPLMLLWCLAASTAFAQNFVPSIGIDYPDCSRTAILNASATGGTLPYTYLWSNQEITPSVTVQGPGTYTVTVTDADGRSQSAIAPLGNHIVPEIVASSPNITCTRRTVTLTVNGAQGSPFIWTDNGTSINPRDITAAGTYTVSITNGKMCTAQVTIADFTTDEVENLQITRCPDSPPYCFSPGDCFTSGSQTRTVQKQDSCFKTTNVTITNITYNILDVGDVLACDSYTVPGTVPAVTHTTSGLYVDSLPGIGANGCRRFVSTNLRVGRNTDMSVTKYICKGDSYAVGDSVYTKTGNYTNVLKSQLATQCDSIIRTTLIVDVTKYEKYVLRRCSTFTFTPPTGSTAAQTFTETTTRKFGTVSLGGCLDSVIYEVTISPTISVTINVAKCPGETYTTGAIGGVGGTVCSVDGQTYTSILPSYQYSDGSGGCDSTTTVNFRIITPRLETVSPKICNGTSYTFGSGADQETYTESGTYIYKEYAYPYQGATQGCDSVITTINLVINDFEVIPYTSYQICNGRTAANILLLTSGGTTPYTYNWTGGLAPIFNPNCVAAGEYTVTVTESSTSSCSYTKVFVILAEDPDVCLGGNEGFTPDGDPFNEYWQIPCIEKKNNTVQVYNRWGQLLFEEKNYTGTWNGSIDGKPLPDGTYYYVVSTDSRTYRGTLTIIRQ